MWELDDALVQRLYQRAHARQWQVPVEAFAAFLARSGQHEFPEQRPDTADLERYFSSLELEDLALACACAEGIDAAWDYFVSRYRPALYRAADAIDPTGGAREVADGLYAELFGLAPRNGERQSHLRYFHGRSSLATWLRAVLSQRYIDRIRRDSRFTPLPPDESAARAPAARTATSSTLLHYLDVLRGVMTAVVAALPARDRLRLRCYYVQNLTLANIGTLLGEHEATVSRNLARTRRTIRTNVEAELRDGHGMTEAEVSECFGAALEDSGPLDVAELLGPELEFANGRKKATQVRSK